MSHPAVSVVIPTYNRAAYLPLAIDSVLAQTFEDWELIVVDDGSTDETVPLVNGYDDPRVRLVQSPGNRGAAAARNLGISEARGRYVSFLDSDDSFVENKLKQQVALFERSDDSVGLIYGDETYEYGDGHQARFAFDGIEPEEGWAFSQLLNHFILRTSTTMVRREAIDKVGLFDEDLATGEDFEWFLRIAHDYQVRVIKDVLTLRRMSTNNLRQDLSKSGPSQLAAATRVVERFGLQESAAARTLSRCHFEYAMYCLNVTNDAAGARKHFLRAARLHNDHRVGWLFWLSSFFGARPYWAVHRLKARLRGSRPQYTRA